MIALYLFFLYMAVLQVHFEAASALPGLERRDDHLNTKLVAAHEEIGEHLQKIANYHDGNSKRYEKSGNILKASKAAHVSANFQEAAQHHRLEATNIKEGNGDSNWGNAAAQYVAAKKMKEHLSHHENKMKEFRDHTNKKVKSSKGSEMYKQHKAAAQNAYIEGATSLNKALKLHTGMELPKHAYKGPMLGNHPERPPT